MPLKVPSFAGLVGALFDYVSGTDQTQGLIPLGKLVYGPDGSAPTAVGDVTGLPVRPRSVAPDNVPAPSALDLTSLTSALTFAPAGYGTGILYVPAFTGAAVLTAEQSQDGTAGSWFAASLHPTAAIGGTAGSKTQTVAASGSGQLFKINFRGVAFFRLVVTTVGTGTVTPQLTATSGAALLGIECADPTRTKVTAVADQFQTFAAPISAGQALSSTVDLGTTRLAGVLIPAAWTATPAGMSFRGSLDGTNFFEVFNDTGTVMALPVAAGSYIPFSNPGQWIGIRYLQVRSGANGSAVNQVSAVSVTLIAVP